LKFKVIKNHAVPAPLAVVNDKVSRLAIGGTVQVTDNFCHSSVAYRIADLLLIDAFDSSRKEIPIELRSPFPLDFIQAEKV